MNLLSIDTSTTRATVAVAINGVIFEEVHEELREHARVILLMIDRLLIKAQISWQDLDGVVFGRGPGSFTGLRIACSVVKGIAYAHNLPVYPVSTLATIAYAYYDQHFSSSSGNNLLAVLDARMNQFYWSYFKLPQSVNTSIFAENPEYVTAASDIICDEKDSVVVVGVGLNLCTTYLHAKYNVSSHNILYPSAANMIKLVWAGSITPVSAEDVLPVYVRNQVTFSKEGGLSG